MSPTIAGCLATLFGFDKQHPPGAWEAIQSQAVVCQMITDYRRELASAPLDDDERKLYSRCLDGMTGALAPFNMGSDKGAVLNLMSAVDLNDLEHADSVLRKFVQETELAKSELAVFKATIEKALLVLQQCELPEKMKDFIAAQLLKVQHAVEQCRFRGMAGIEETLAAYSGSLLMAREEFARLPSEQMHKLMQVLEAGQKVVNLAKGTASLWPLLVQGAHVVATTLGLPQ